MLIFHSSDPQFLGPAQQGAPPQKYCPLSLDSIADALEPPLYLIKLGNLPILGFGLPQGNS